MKHLSPENKTALICFTAAFPLGRKETFFANELPYLTQRFHTVLLLPRYYESNVELARPLPPNATYFKPKVPGNKFKRILTGLFNTAPISFYIDDFFRFKVFQSRRKFINWFNSMLVFRANYLWQKKVILESDERFSGNILLYSYWAEAPMFITKFCRTFTKVLRMHRVDFYLDVNHGYLPLRQRIYDTVDLLLPISNDIANILQRHYGISDAKIFLSRLGVFNPTNRTNANRMQGAEGNLIRIVSCSRIESVKRVHLIVEALKLYNGPQKIEWHHFGDGVLFDDIKKRAVGFPENVQAQLHGWAAQEKIFGFYKTYRIDWLVNVSESEGIPVSIMEAMSFGIPVIATDVGATAEIVDNSNGYLLPVDVSIQDLLENILSATKDNYYPKRDAALLTWERRYKADSNYTLLGEKLAGLVMDDI